MSLRLRPRPLRSCCRGPQHAGGVPHWAARRLRVGTRPEGGQPRRERSFWGRSANLVRFRYAVVTERFCLRGAQRIRSPCAITSAPSPRGMDDLRRLGGTGRRGVQRRRGKAGCDYGRSARLLRRVVSARGLQKRDHTHHRGVLLRRHAASAVRRRTTRGGVLLRRREQALKGSAEVGSSLIAPITFVMLACSGCGSAATTTPIAGSPTPAGLTSAAASSSAATSSRASNLPTLDAVIHGGTGPTFDTNASGYCSPIDYKPPYSYSCSGNLGLGSVSWYCSSIDYKPPYDYSCSGNLGLGSASWYCSSIDYKPPYDYSCSGNLGLGSASWYCSSIDYKPPYDYHCSGDAVPVRAAMPWLFSR
jgi:hypothetical protein